MRLTLPRSVEASAGTTYTVGQATVLTGMLGPAACPVNEANMGDERVAPPADLVTSLLRT